MSGQGKKLSFSCQSKEKESPITVHKQYYLCINVTVCKGNNFILNKVYNGLKI